MAIFSASAGQPGQDMFDRGLLGSYTVPLLPVK